MEYLDFIRQKVRRPESFGFEPIELNRHLFPWQADIVRWACRRGRAALFEDTGLGKTLQQLAWADAVYRHTGRNVMIHCPIGVRPQTKREADKFGIPGVHVVDEQSEVLPGISLVNYGKLHKFNPKEFVGVVLDESSILKNYTGATKRKLVEQWRLSQYRLACTATPAPNDHMEIGNHAEFLGVMPSNEMLSRWFVNDTMRAGGYRLRGHAAQDFWNWVASWAVCVVLPSDVGGDDDGFILPEKIEIEHVVHEEALAGDGFLFASWDLSATNVHRQKRRTAAHRAAKVAEIVAAEPSEAWILWCDTDYEADELLTRIPEAVEVRGSHPDHIKEERLLGFAEGTFRILVSKPTIAGFGMNYQHCSRMSFIGLSYSYEQFYQAVRRCYRFGQTRQVHVHIVESDGEAAFRKTVKDKEFAHATMKGAMADSMRRKQIECLHGELERERYNPQKKMEIPQWLSQLKTKSTANAGHSTTGTAS